jgi:RNA polymerase sigma factor (sigma-70 family)
VTFPRIEWCFNADEASGDDGSPSRPPSIYDSADRRALHQRPAIVDVDHDAAWVSRLRVGDEAALESGMRVWAPKLYRIAWSITRSAAAAEEVVQDVFMTVWDRRDALEESGNVGGYLYRLTRNRALNVYRGERTRDRAVQASALDRDDPPSEPLDEQAELRARAYVILETLPRQMREIFLLRWTGNMAPPEIGELLGITVRTVYNQLYRASRRIESELSRK